MLSINTCSGTAGHSMCNYPKYRCSQFYFFVLGTTTPQISGKKKLSAVGLTFLTLSTIRPKPKPSLIDPTLLLRQKDVLFKGKIFSSKEDEKKRIAQNTMGGRHHAVCPPPTVYICLFILLPFNTCFGLFHIFPDRSQPNVLA